MNGRLIRQIAQPSRIVYKTARTRPWLLMAKVCSVPSHSFAPAPVRSFSAARQSKDKYNLYSNLTTLLKSFSGSDESIAGRKVRQRDDAQAAMGKSKYYGVARGRQPGVYTSWAECEAQVKGVPARFKGFKTQQEAEDFVANEGHPPLDSMVTTSEGDQKKKVPRSVKRKVDEIDTHTPERTGKNLKASPAPSFTTTSDGARIIEVYTDGASAGNGRDGAAAGWGVHWPGAIDDPACDLAGLDESARLPGELQTNNRAELMAIIRACQLCPDRQAQLRIYTDSQYSIKAVTEWQIKWRLNGWMRGTGSQRTAVLNKDLIRRLEREFRNFARRPELIYVKGHDSSAGNNEADRLAVAGAALPAIPQSQWPSDIEPSDSSGEEGPAIDEKARKEKRERERAMVQRMWEKAGFSVSEAEKRASR